MPDEFISVPVSNAWDESPRLRALVLDLGGTGLAARFTEPGQYVKVRLPGTGKDAFMAIASAPGGEAVELLVQKTDGTAVADAIATVPAGGRLEITAPAGTGFPVRGERGRDVLLLAGGSGISAIRSALEYVAAHRDEYGRTVLVFGARRADDLAYQKLFEGWRKARVEVEPTLSRPDDGSWTGRTGYVTAVFRDLALDAARTSAFVAGSREFLLASTTALTALGIAPDRIFKNF